MWPKLVARFSVFVQYINSMDIVRCRDAVYTLKVRTKNGGWGEGSDLQ